MSKIPRLGGSVPSGVLAPKDPNIENVGDRKRKAASPVKPARSAAAKRQAQTTEAVVIPTAPASVDTAQTAIAIQQPTIAAPVVTVTVPPGEAAAWLEISEKNGWSVQDCLEHKISFPKRADAKSKIDALAAHLKQIRAAGWYLLAESQTLSIDCATLKSQLQQETVARADAEELLSKAQVELTSTQQRLTTATEAATKFEKECEEMTIELEQTVKYLEKEKTQHEGVAEKLKVAEDANAESQKYAMQLQTYNTQVQSDLTAANESLASLREEKAALSEEVAALRGKSTALGEALSALQTSAVATEASRTAAIEDAAKLRAELNNVQEDKTTATAELKSVKTQLEDTKSDLERYRIATGKDLADLERTQARTKAQAEINHNLQEQVTLLREERSLAQMQADSKGAEAAKLAARVAELEAALADSERRLHSGEQLRRKLHNTILELKGNIRVFCRVRGTKEQESSSSLSLPTSGDLTGRAVDIDYVPEGSKTSKEPQHHTFSFDRVFGPSSQQSEVFEEVSQLVQSALDGYRVCIFAYGQTGSGKTYTMLGCPENEGIIPRATRQVFETAELQKEHGWMYDMKAAMVEVYNEELRDLLGSSSSLPAGKKHQVSHDDKGNLVVSYLEWKPVSDGHELNALLSRAMKQRAVGATAMNEQSSRSHMVFMLQIEGKNSTTGQRVSGMLNLVDLAGSERLSKSGVNGNRLKETQNINKSLSALGDVINALGSKEHQHIPYRNSKLTFLLQNSLSGSSKTLMLCSLNPSVENTQETLCTLRFAAKVNATEIGTARRNLSTAS